MLPIAVQEQLDGQPHVSAALLQEVVAGVALGENIFQLLRVGNRPLDMDFIQLQVGDVQNLVAGHKPVGLKDLALLAGAELQQIHHAL